jgi:hypothetical protein
MGKEHYQNFVHLINIIYTFYNGNGYLYGKDLRVDD